MMNIKHLCKILFFIILFIGSKNIQAQFSIDAYMRPRFEFRNGYRDPISANLQPAFIISQRTRLSLNYTNDKLTLKLSPQDVRVWGDEQLASSTGLYGDNASLDLHEAYAQISLMSQLKLKLGRQEFAYDHERLLGKRNWNQNGLSYDAVLCTYDTNNYNIHLGFSWNSLTSATFDNIYLPERIKSLNFLWLKYSINKNLNLSLTQIASGVSETDSTNNLHFRQTTGFYSEYKSSGFNYKIDFYYQYGKNNSGQNVLAFLTDIDLSYICTNTKTGFGISMLSGDNNLNDNTDKLFSVLYGARHRYFGHMDYFRDFNSHTKQGGLIDLYGYFEYNICKNISIKNTGHYFNLAQTNSLTPTNKALGYENEIELKYKMNNNINIKASYLFYLPTDNFKQLKNKEILNFQQFTFIEITINPKIFDQNK